MLWALSRIEPLLSQQWQLVFVWRFQPHSPPPMSNGFGAWAKPIHIYLRVCLMMMCSLNFRAELNLNLRESVDPQRGQESCNRYTRLTLCSALEFCSENKHTWAKKSWEVYGAGTYTASGYFMVIFLFINSLIFPHAAICRKHTLYIWDFYSCCQGELDYFQLYQLLPFNIQEKNGFL